ncbi:DUF3017 domain-containing protein [Kytococcus sedentarius]|uniref:DUF3017 domain-containing protein n=1 Tax=Kytococcus sedentarius TaxID=1276 RepID=UPI0035BBCB95
MTRTPETPPGAPGRWSGPLRDKRGPAIHPGEGLADLALWWLPAVCLMAGLALVYLHEVRFGIVVMAVGAAGGALARAVVPRRVAGGLALRSRGVDVAMWSLMALLLWVMSRAIEL